VISWQKSGAGTFGFVNAMTSDAPDHEPIVTTELQSPLGTLVAGATRDGVCLLEFAGPQRIDDHFKIVRPRGAVVVRGENDHLARLRDELHAYFAGTLTAFTTPLVTTGTPFEERVWAALRTVPYGVTTSYGEVARAIGESTLAARAVGRANGRNPVAIVIPCHRVIGHNHTLVGYGGGLWRKQRLLELEGRQRRLV
jgi:AraC family transcriptional regulator of adaptative response/methylated-DNA-[protein]-cysteine methyltransferase